MPHVDAFEARRKMFEELHKDKLQFLEETFKERFCNPFSDVDKVGNTIFHVVMMNGGSETDNDTFMAVGENLEQAFERVIVDIKEFFESKPRFVKTTGTALDRI
jgi:hypothetical protein